MSNKRRPRRRKNKSFLFIVALASLAVLFFFVKLKTFRLQEDGISVFKGKEKISKTDSTAAIKKDGAGSGEKSKRLFNFLEKERNASIRLLAVGDVMFHGPQLEGAYNREQDRYDFSAYFAKIKPYVESADIAFANYETTMAEGIKPISTYPQFNSPVESLELLRDSGFDVLSTANNHCLDTGKAGIISTIDGITAYDMKHIGTRKSAEDARILYKEVRGIKVATLAYTYGFNGLEANLSKEERGAMLQPINEEQMQEDISQAMNGGADLIVSCIHWGEEYSTTPSKYQQELADKMFHWGVDIIFGSHPHVLQRAEEREINGKKKFVIYSMGNFISNQRVETLNNKHTESGVIVAVNVDKDLKLNTTEIKEVELIPTWVYRSPSKPYSYSVLPSKEYLDNPELLGSLDKKSQDRLEDSYKTSLEILQ